MAVNILLVRGAASLARKRANGAEKYMRAGSRGFYFDGSADRFGSQ